MALQEATPSCVEALAAQVPVPVACARAAGALRVIALARPHVSCEVVGSWQAQVPGADPDRHGLLALRLELAPRGGEGASVVFVSGHLPPGEGRAARRSAALRDCVRDLGDECFEGADHIIFAGDLNYRLFASRESATRKAALDSMNARVAASDWSGLSRLDELDCERARGHAFAGYDAAPIADQPPTATFNGAPAYADRVLWSSRPT